jgi:PhnB protein
MNTVNEETKAQTAPKLCPMLALSDCAAAIEFYKRAFGAVEVCERYAYEGKIGYASINIDGAVLMLADEFPEYNVTPQRLGGTPIILHLDVDDADAVMGRAVAAGAEVIYPPKNEEYGRVCTILDPYGYKWMLNGPVKS